MAECNGGLNGAVQAAGAMVRIRWRVIWCDPGRGAAVTYYSIQQRLSIRLRFKLAAGVAEPLAVGVVEPCTGRWDIL